MKKIKLILKLPTHSMSQDPTSEQNDEHEKIKGEYIEFVGESIGYHFDSPANQGELVFNTSMTGYQEVISDPSYCDQIILMTYPLIGNYGMNKDDFESLKPSLKGLVVRECPVKGYNWRNEYSLRDFLHRFKLPGLAGIDTREVTKIIRTHGTLQGFFAPENFPLSDAEKFYSNHVIKNQVEKVSLQSCIHFPGPGKRVILIDFGHKKSLLKSLQNRGCDVVVVPWNCSYDEIKNFSPQGVVLSNGPGDPMSIGEVVLPTIKKIQENFPLFGICLGHQLFALANGAQTEKLKFGHRGSNHPVKDLISGKVYMSSQNHSYSVVSPSSPDLEVTQINLNDGSIEGLRHKLYPSFSVQYHPESNPGPYDTEFLFDEFILTL